MIRLAYAVDETRALATREVKAVLHRDKEVAFLILEVLDKNNQGV